MKTIFESDCVIVTVDSDNELSVTVKPTMFTSAALHSLGKRIVKLQKRVAELETHYENPPATLEVTSEPIEYFYYAENSGEQCCLSGVFSVRNFNSDTFLKSVKKQIVDFCWEGEQVKTNPEDWVVKSLSRL